MLAAERDCLQQQVEELQKQNTDLLLSSSAAAAATGYRSALADEVMMIWQNCSSNLQSLQQRC